MCSLRYLQCINKQQGQVFTSGCMWVGRVLVQVTKSMLDARLHGSFPPCCTSAPTPNPTPYCSYSTLKDILWDPEKDGILSN